MQRRKFPFMQQLPQQHAIRPISVAGTIVLSLLVLVKMILPLFLIHDAYELHRDEFLHLDQALHPAAGFYSLPPFSSWVGMFIHLLGGGSFWVQFFPALFGTLTMILVWHSARILGGGLFACSIAGFCFLFSVVLRLNLLFQPNSFDVLAWTGVYYALIRYRMHAVGKWLYAAAVAAALGFLNKYNIVFLLAPMLPALLLSGGRHIFKDRHFYVAAGLALLLVSPNLIWQLQHHFPVLHHMEELQRTQLVHTSAKQFLVEQVVFFIGGLPLIVAAVIALIRYRPFRPLRFILWSFAGTIALFVVLKGKGYYAIGLYPVWLSIGAVYLEKNIAGRSFAVWFRPLLFFLAFGLFLPPLFAIFPILEPAAIANHTERFRPFGVLRWEDGMEHPLPQDFADMQGWRELAAIAGKARRDLPAGSKTLVLCNNYGQAGAVNYYNGKNFGAVSYNADYLNWFPELRGLTTVIRIRESGDTVPAAERMLFQKVTFIDSVRNPFAREHGTSVYLMEGAHPSVPGIVAKRLQEEIAAWERRKTQPSR